MVAVFNRCFLAGVMAAIPQEPGSTGPKRAWCLVVFMIPMWVSCHPHKNALLVIGDVFIYLFIYYIYIPPHSRSSLGSSQKFKNSKCLKQYTTFKNIKGIKTAIS